MIKACVFDLDGTILDTIGTICHFVNVTLDKFSIRRISIEECKIFVGNGAKILIDRTLKSRGIDDPVLKKQVLDDYNAAYNSDPYFMTSPFRGIPELIASLREMGIGIAVVSNKPDFLTRPIVSRFFGDSVDVTFGGRDGVPLKPAPDAVCEAISILGAEGFETVYIGDTGTDMQTGRALGAALVVGVLWGFREEDELRRDGADVIVSYPSEILTEVQKVNA